MLDSTRPTVVVNGTGLVVGTAEQLADGNVVAPLLLLRQCRRRRDTSTSNE